MLGGIVETVEPDSLADRLGLEVIACDRNDPLRNLEKVFS